MLEKLARQYGLSEEEVQYVLEQGVEKVAAEEESGRNLRRFLPAATGVAAAGLGAGLAAKRYKNPQVMRQMLTQAKEQGITTPQLRKGIRAATGVVGAGAGALGVGAGILANRRHNAATAEDVEKTAAAYGLDPEEMEYLLEQGLEKVAAGRFYNKDLYEDAIAAGGGKVRSFLNSTTPLTRRLAGAGALAGAAYGGKKLLDRRRAAATEEDVEKTAAAYGLEPEEMEYLLEQGLEKVAADKGHGMNKFKLFNKKDYAKAALGAGALAGAAYGGKKLLDRRRAAATEEDVEKTAAAYGLAPEEMEYLLEQGLEKVAFSTQDVKGRVVEMIQGTRQKVPGGYAGMAGIGAAAAGAAYGGKKLLDRRREQQDEEALFEMAEKTAAAYGLEPEEMEYLLEQGLEKVSYELEG